MNSAAIVSYPCSITGFLTAALCLALLLGCEPPSGEPSSKARDVTQYAIEDFLGTVSYRGASFSPDNSKILVSSDESGVFNAYTIPVEGGPTLQLTTSQTDYVRTRGFFPADERFIYTSDSGGNELNHVYVKNPDGAVIDLTPGDGLKAIFYGWSQDDSTFYIGTNERDNRYFDVYEYHVDTYEREMVFQNTDGYNYTDISPDRRYVALGKTHSNADSDVYLYDRETEEIKHITPHEGDVQNAPLSFSADGLKFYFLTDLDSEFQNLVRLDLATDKRETIIEAGWDVWYAYESKRGSYLVVGINNDARTELQIYDAAAMTRVELPHFDDASISSVSISRDESKVAFYVGSSSMPNDVFVYDFGGGEPKQLTRSLNDNIDREDLVDGQVVRFISHGNVEVPGILYKPHQASSDNKVPAIVWVHGGPGGQSRIGYFYLLQYLVNHGYAVYAINNRGSSGYGKTFFHMDDRKHGEVDLDDCVESKKMLAATGWIDPDRIGILGGSYGGYITLAALAFRPEEFNAGVDLFGISNWHRTVTSIPPWWEAYRESLQKELGDFDDEDFFRDKSPLFHASNIVRPLIVLQGANDPRVLQEESDQIVEAVRANGVPVDYVLFDDEGHGFVKKKNQEEAARRILAFLDVHLRP